MNSSFFFLMLLLAPGYLYAQNAITISRDTLIGKEAAIILSNDSIIRPGSTIKCGRGTLPNGSFKYLHTSSTSWVAMMSATQADPTAGVTPLSKSYGGLNLQVKSVKKLGNKKRGCRYVLKVGGGNIVNYDVEIEDAIAVGEVVGPNVSASPAVASSSAPSQESPADELKKLKSLLDAGAITQQEYDSTKKKILAKM
jgi:Short C-terminal domain